MDNHWLFAGGEYSGGEFAMTDGPSFNMRHNVSYYNRKLEQYSEIFAGQRYSVIAYSRKGYSDISDYHLL